MKILISGGSGTGKSFLASKLAKASGLPVLRTDTLLRRYQDTKIIARTISQYLDLSDMIIEGTLALRGLKRWMNRHPDEKPVDKVLFLTKTWEGQTAAQRAQAVGIQAQFNELRPRLEELGVEIEIQ